MSSPAEKTPITDTFESLEPTAPVTVTGRNVEVPEHFADRLKAKLAKIERLDSSITAFQVELKHEPNPRRSDRADRIQITASGKGHVLRAEAREDSFYAALETAIARMERSLRKVKARRAIAFSGHRAPKGAGELAAEILGESGQVTPAEESNPEHVDPYEHLLDEDLPGKVVRSKEHSSHPMSVDEALSEMELVGHDFFLFVNEETDRPSVVYRRHAYDYGLIELKP